MSREEIIDKLQTFLSYREKLPELKGLRIDDEKQAQHFIAEVSAVLNHNARRVWNDWGYVDPIGAAIMVDGFAALVGQNLFPDFNSITKGITVLSGLFALAGVMRHRSLQKLTRQGTEAVEEKLMGITVTDKLSVWQYNRLQNEIILRFVAVEMDPKKFANLYNCLVQPNKGRSFNTKQVADFIRELGKLLPAFYEQMHRTTKLCRSTVHSGGTLLVVGSVYALHRLGKDVTDVYGIILAMFVIWSAVQIRKYAFMMKYGSNLVGEWDLRRIDAIVALLQNEYEIERQPEIKLPSPKSIPVAVEEKTTYKSKNRSARKKPKTCNETLVQAGALLCNMVKAVALFGFQIVSEPFCAVFRVGEQTGKEKNPPKPKEAQQPVSRSVAEVEEKAPKKRKKPATKKAVVEEIGNSIDSDLRDESELSSVAQPVEQTAEVVESKSAPVELLGIQESFNDKATDNSAALDLPVEQAVAVIELLSPAPVTPPIAQSPVLLMPIPAATEVEEKKSFPMPAQESKPIMLTVTLPEAFDKATIEAQVSATDVSPWAALNLSDQEELAILRKTYSTVWHKATRHYYEIQSLRNASKPEDTQKPPGFSGSKSD